MFEVKYYIGIDLKKNQKEIIKLICSYFDGGTFYRGVGFYGDQTKLTNLELSKYGTKKGKLVVETCTIIEILTKGIGSCYALKKDLERAFNQGSVPMSIKSVDVEGL